jgi:hypothetical protein
MKPTPTNSALRAANAILQEIHDLDHEPGYLMSAEYEADRDELARIIDKKTGLPLLQEVAIRSVPLLVELQRIYGHSKRTPEDKNIVKHALLAAEKAARKAGRK